MNLKIGNQTAFAAKSTLEPFEFALENAFQAFEFFPDRGPGGVGGWEEQEMSEEQRGYVRRAAEACDLTLTVHAPLAYDPLQEPDDSKLERIVDFVRDIGAGLLNLHLDMSQGAEAFGRALAPVLEATRKANLKLSLENTVLTGPEDFNVFFKWLQTKEPRLMQDVGVCFDLGHANVCSATHNDYCGFLDQLNATIPIIHLHLHENFGDRDSHQPLFTGPARENPAGIIGMLRRLKARDYQGCGILEQWPEPSSLLCEARDKLCLVLNAVD